MQVPGFFESAERLFEMFDVDAVAFHFDATTLETMALSDAEVNEVGGVFDEDDVVRITKGFGQHVKELLRAVGDQGEGGGAGGGRGLAGSCLIKLIDAVGGERSQTLIPGGGAVLEGGPSGGAGVQDLIEQPFCFLNRERFIVRKTSSQGDQMRMIEGHFHEP